MKTGQGESLAFQPSKSLLLYSSNSEHPKTQGFKMSRVKPSRIGVFEGSLSVTYSDENPTRRSPLCSKNQTKIDASQVFLIQTLWILNDIKAFVAN